jgi:hypothetical protein
MYFILRQSHIAAKKLRFYSNNDTPTIRDKYTIPHPIAGLTTEA